MVPSVMQRWQRSYFESQGATVDFNVSPNFGHWFKPTVAYDANKVLLEQLTNNTVNEPDADWRSNGVLGKFD